MCQSWYVRKSAPIHINNWILTWHTHTKTGKQTIQSLRDVLHGGLRFVPQQSVDGHHYPWSAEATLGAVSLRYSLLQKHSHMKRLSNHTFLWRGHPEERSTELKFNFKTNKNTYSSQQHLPAPGGSGSWCCRCPPPWWRRRREAGTAAGGRRWRSNVRWCGEGKLLTHHHHYWYFYYYLHLGVAPAILLLLLARC